MKNWNWQQWTAFGLVIAVIITAFVLHMVQPQVPYSFTEIASLVMFGLGILCGYLLPKKKCTCEKQVLKD
jgi:uncharacterized membrane protein (DUF4010 family)